VNERRVGIVMNGVTGRMGLRQHLERSIVAIREQGGILAADGSTIIPEPVLVGRNEAKLRRIADQYGLTRWTTDLSEALAEPDVEIYFDSQLTQLLREADRREPGSCGRSGPAGPGHRPEERRRPGQAVAARPAEAEAAGRRRLLRADPLGPW
jgi:hypothetical protein